MSGKIAVITFPGSNCDQDCRWVVKNVLGQDAMPIWFGETELPAIDALILPGGFSYGDYLRSGAMAAHAPIMPAIKEFANNGGRVLGICNGFQILCETGLLDGALLPNASAKFICKTVALEVGSTTSVLTKNSKIGEITKLPIAHGDGRYFADEETLDRLEKNNQVVVRYHGENPNGSQRNIAGISNDKGNVVGLMPHPERAAEDILSNCDGLNMMRAFVDEGRV